MITDRLWRAGPFRGGLLSDVKTLLSYNPSVVAQLEQPAGKELMNVAATRWQSVNKGVDIKKSGITKEGHILFTLLNEAGADPVLAAKFVKSLTKVYATLTFSPVKFDQLTRAKPFLIDMMGDVPLSTKVAKEITSIPNNEDTGVVYLEVACRSLIAANRNVISRFYDEVEVQAVSSNVEMNVPIRMPYLAPSRFILIRSTSKSNELIAEHVPSSKVLAALISEDPLLVDAVIQIIGDYTVFRSEVNRRLWMAKHLLLANLGASRALWVRNGGILHTSLTEAYLSAGDVHTIRSSFDGVFPRLIAPISSEISQSEWIRIGSSSRVLNVGLHKPDDLWEFEIIAPEAIAELPVVNEKISWVLRTMSPHTGTMNVPFSFKQLELDSTSIRSIALVAGDAFTNRKSAETTTKKPLEAAKKPANPPVLAQLPVDALNEDEQKIFEGMQDKYKAAQSSIDSVVANAVATQGPIKGKKRLQNYIDDLFANVKMDDTLANTIDGWNTQFTNGERAVARKLVAITASKAYNATYSNPKESINE